jgi:hypothetical protein
MVRAASRTPSLSKSIVTVYDEPPLAGKVIFALKSGSPALTGAVACRRIESVRACSIYPASSRSEAESRIEARARVMPITAKVETIEMIASVMQICMMVKPRSAFCVRRACCLFRLIRFNITFSNLKSGFLSVSFTRVARDLCLLKQGKSHATYFALLNITETEAEEASLWSRALLSVTECEARFIVLLRQTERLVVHKSLLLFNDKKKETHAHLLRKERVYHKREVIHKGLK